MSTIRQGTEFQTILSTTLDPTIGLGVRGGTPNLLLLRTTTNQLYYYKGPLDTDWGLLTPAATSYPPASPSPAPVNSILFDDFVGFAGWDTFLLGGGATAGLSVPEAGTCGLVAIATNLAADVAAIDLNQNWFEMQVFNLNMKTRLKVSQNVSAGNDFRSEVGFVNTNGVLLSAGAYFRCGNAQNGNNNWNAFVSGAAAINTGITVGSAGLYRDYEIIFNLVTNNWTFFIDGVLVATIAAQAALVGISRTLGYSLLQVGGLASGFITMDYMSYNYGIR